ncbi:MAG TPA: aminomethyl-transferring glycine dehydrogenase subunit GcvPB [Deinococcales bacterium]|nr:aminomethyl-transferring glycine dehydrogenase subunit GcvPB [Deinococcales bacterium]
MSSPKDFPTIFERSRPGRRAAVPPQAALADGTDLAALLGEENLRRAPLRLPEVSELDLVRHYTGLAGRQFSVDANFYPLGSCTMKYNPKVHEVVAAEFTGLNPNQDPSTAQGALQLMHTLQHDLAVITGMDAVTLQPAAGAHGEFTGILIIRKHFETLGQLAQRRVVLVPDSAHGTNPASAAMAGFEVREIPSAANGEVDFDAFEAALGPDIAAVMLTNPNTLGLFETRIERIARAAHAHGVQLYYDGANLNAIVGRARPGDMGFDVIHMNLHKTFTVPHGGGGPGTGPVAVKAHLAPYLPVPVVTQGSDGTYHLDSDRPQSIGHTRSFYGNFSNLVRAYAYIRSLGPEGLRDVSGMAVLNANYLRVKVREAGFAEAHERTCMHEFVAQPPKGLRTLDVAKALLDHGVHPMTVYFPLVVPEAMMVEPTETESLETLDAFARALAEVKAAWEENPEALHAAPVTTPVGRLDEVTAAKRPILRARLEPLGENDPAAARR